MNLQQIVAEILNHLRGMWRYRWWSIGVAWALSMVGWFYVYSLPDVYRASARVYVDTFSLLRPLMQGLTATRNTMNDVQLLTRAVVTRPNLEKVAYATDLDLRAKTPEDMEELITGLQRKIQISGGRDNIYTFQYEDPSREMAREVVAAVLDTFVEGALGNSGNDVQISERALANELEIHERRLREAEERRARFKQENIGYMPGEAGDYYNQLQAALGRLAATERALQLAINRRDELRRQITGEDPVIGIMPFSQGLGCSQSGQISQLEAQLDNLRVQFTEKHPRVLTLEDMISHLQQECAAEAQAASEGGALSIPATSSLDGNPVYQNLRIQLSDADVEIAGLNAQLRSQNEEVERLRQDVDKITKVETDLRQLDRDYGVIQARYQELLRRWEDLQAKMRIDPVADGVTFERIEPPFALADPVGPNRPLMLGAVFLISFAAGGALAFALNQMNPVFFTGAKLRQVIDYPVIGSITMILPPDVVARRRAEAVAWSTAFVLLVVSTGAVVALAPSVGPALRRILEGVGA